MLRNVRLQMVAVLAAGALLGYLAASGRLNPFQRAEAALVTRREETAAIRMQANTARIFESNPTLLKLRELEVLEQVAAKANLTVVLGEGGLAERVVKML